MGQSPVETMDSRAPRVPQPEAGLLPSRRRSRADDRRLDPRSQDPPSLVTASARAQPTRGHMDRVPGRRTAGAAERHRSRPSSAAPAELVAVDGRLRLRRWRARPPLRSSRPAAARWTQPHFPPRLWPLRAQWHNTLRRRLSPARIRTMTARRVAFRVVRRVTDGAYADRAFRAEAAGLPRWIGHSLSRSRTARSSSAG